ncbi:MAG: hypothetical protein OXG56_06215 [Gammaproteobacteria bacterium]|nr:hypothetical protein [Gammaproteobacteria bacterium]
MERIDRVASLDMDAGRGGDDAENGRTAGLEKPVVESPAKTARLPSVNDW